MVHVVDPDPAIADGLATLFFTYGIHVYSYPDAESFLQEWRPCSPCHCCLLVEANLPGMSGPALLQELQERHIEPPVLLLVSTSTPELIEVALSSGRIGVIEKPCLNGTLINKVLRLREQV